MLIIIISWSCGQFGKGAGVDSAELRSTPQRRAVLDVLTAARDHPSAAEVYDRVRLRLPGIGPATVYRTLGLLVASGAARELSLGGDSGAARYDANTERHDHLVCDACGAAVDVDAPIPAGLAREIAARTGFTVDSYDLQFHGRCPTCQEPSPSQAPYPSP